MCKYCKNVSTGDDWTPITNVDVDLGFVGKLMLDLAMSRENDKPCIGIYGCMDCKDDYFEIVKPVNYCPVCGEKLI